MCVCVCVCVCVCEEAFHVVKKRCHDEVVGGLCTFGVGDGWFQLYQDHKQWSELCSSVVGILAQNSGAITRIQCVCGHTFRRKGPFK